MIEALCGTNEPDVPFLDEIPEVHSAELSVVLGDPYHEAQVGLDQRATGRSAIGYVLLGLTRGIRMSRIQQLLGALSDPHPSSQRLLFVCREEIDTADLREVPPEVVVSGRAFIPLADLRLGGMSLCFGPLDFLRFGGRLANRYSSVVELGAKSDRLFCGQFSPVDGSNHVVL